MSFSLLNLPRPVGSDRARLLRGGLQAAICVFAAVLAIYRLVIFVPQPLDGPNTLRPILNAWFDAFLWHYQSPDAAYEDWRSFCLLALLVAPVLAVLNLVSEHGTFKLPQWASKIICSRALFLAVTAATLLLCRVPALLDYSLNPDEGEFLSGAHKLFYDGNYFHSVDCGSSGPLNIYPLMLPAVFGFSPDYASSRLLTLLSALGVIYVFYRTIRLLASDAIARIAILPLAAAFTVFENPNLVHYNSEHIPVLLIALAFYLAVRVLRNPEVHRLPLFLLGFLVSGGFFSKMQSVPILAVIGAVAVAYTYASGRARSLWWSVLLFVAGMLPLQLVNAAMCLAGGVWTNFWISYIASNQRYTENGGNFIMELPRLIQSFVDTPEIGYFLLTFLALCASHTLERLRADRPGERNGFLQMAVAGAVVVGVLMAALRHSQASAILSYLALTAIFTACMFFFTCYEKGSFGADLYRWFGLLSIVAAAAALFSIYRPHRFFPHYLFFLLLPVSAGMAWMLMWQTGQSSLPDGTINNPDIAFRRSSRLAFPLLFAALALTQATYLWGSRDPHMFRTTVSTIREPEGDFIRSLTSSRGKIFVWGWNPDPYLGSGRVTATRDLNLFYQFLAPEEITSYYRRRLLDDLKRDPPELIVDAIGSHSWFLQDSQAFGLDQVPEIGRFVHDSYRQIAVAYQQRFFLRADLMARTKGLKMPPVCAPTAVQCAPTYDFNFSSGVTAPVIQNLDPVEMPKHALIQVQFTPFGRQRANATIFNNEAVPHSFLGFRFQNMGGDLYRLILGVGDRWAFSRPILLADTKPVWLNIEFVGTEVHIQANDVTVDTMFLPTATADSPGPVTIGSWIDGECRFSGKIQFFQIVDLGETHWPYP